MSKPNFRVVLNPTGERYGASHTAHCDTRIQAEQLIAWYAEHLDPSLPGFIIVDDEPRFGGEHSDQLLRIDSAGERSGRWATA